MKSIREALDFTGKAVLATGGSGALGAGISRVFAETGAALFLGCHREQRKAEAEVQVFRNW